MSLNIDELNTQPEGKTLEFKRDISSPKPLLKTLVAFANTAGGRLIIGVGDDKQIVGVEDPLAEEERLCNLIADSIAPRLVPNIELITMDGRTVLIAEVFLSNSRPHFLRSEGPENGVYVRLGSTNRQADRELIAELRRSVEGVSFDEMPLPDLSSDSLDLTAAQALFGHKRQLDEEALLTLKLLTREQGRIVPTIGGVLLFGKKREMRFPDAWIQCGRFIGTDKAHIFDHIENYEHLPVAVESVMIFLKKHAMRGADFSEIRRKDVWSIPLAILREAVINAIVHTDYSQIGAPIRVAFFNDRIEVENPGILLPGLTIEDICRGVSKIRNRVICRVFRESDLIEQWGSGILRMFDDARKLGLPEPKIEEIGMRVRFTVYLAESISLEQKPKVNPVQITPANIHNADMGTMLAPSRHQVEILKKCENETPLSGLMTLAGRTDRTKFRNSVLNPLLDAGLIEMTQPDSPRSPTQKYRLTEKGSRFLTTKHPKHTENTQ